MERCWTEEREVEIKGNTATVARARDLSDTVVCQGLCASHMFTDCICRTDSILAYKMGFSLGKIPQFRLRGVSACLYLYQASAFLFTDQITHGSTALDHLSTRPPAPVHLPQSVRTCSLRSPLLCPYRVLPVLCLRTGHILIFVWSLDEGVALQSYRNNWKDFTLNSPRKYKAKTFILVMDSIPLWFMTVPGEILQELPPSFLSIHRL